MNTDFDKCNGFKYYQKDAVDRAVCKFKELCLRFTVRAKDVDWFIIPVHDESLEKECQNFKGDEK